MVFGIVLSGREAPVCGIEAMVGLLMSTLPLRVRIEESCLDLAFKVQESLQSVAAHQRLDLRDDFRDEKRASEVLQHGAGPCGNCSDLEIEAEIRSWCGPGAAQDLFQSMLVFENYPAAEVDEAVEVGLEPNLGVMCRS